MAIRYLGNKSTLYINALDGSGELAGVCNKTLEYERTRELIETTTLQGEEVGHVLGLKRGSASFNNLSLFMEPGDEGYYDELCRGWFEDGKLLFCSLRDEVDSNVRVINFYAYIEQYRIVRNNNEAASFDLQLRQTTPNLGDVCPVVVFDSYIDPVQNQIYNTDYTFTGNPLIGSYTIRLLLGSTLIYEDTVTNTGVITGTWEDLLPDTLFTVQILPDGEDEGCNYSFFSFGVPCPVLVLNVGTTSVDISSTPDPQITRVIYQISTSPDPDDIFDSAVTTTPFAASFTGLDEDTAYFVRAIIQIFESPEVRYTRTCGWVEFTTGQPFTVVVANQTNGNSHSITAVQENSADFITILSGGFPVESGGTLTGTHPGFTGVIEVTVTGTGDFTLSLSINNTFIECQSLNGAGTYPLSSQTYDINDIITIVIQNGTCD